MACAFDQFVPKKKIYQKNSRPWYNSELKKLRNKRNKEYNKKKVGLPNTYHEVKGTFDERNKQLYVKYCYDLGSASLSA